MKFLLKEKKWFLVFDTMDELFVFKEAFSTYQIKLELVGFKKLPSGKLVDIKAKLSKE